MLDLLGLILFSILSYRHFKANEKFLGGLAFTIAVLNGVSFLG